MEKYKDCYFYTFLVSGGVFFGGRAWGADLWHHYFDSSTAQMIEAVSGTVALVSLVFFLAARERISRAQKK